jgi:hypothetical protein
MIRVSLQTNDENDGVTCGLHLLPHRGDTFDFRWKLYRVSDVRHVIEHEGGFENDHRITLVLEPKC